MTNGQEVSNGRLLWEATSPRKKREIQCDPLAYENFVTRCMRVRAYNARKLTRLNFASAVLRSSHSPV